jgi:hypothetical protein
MVPEPETSWEFTKREKLSRGVGRIGVLMDEDILSRRDTKEDTNQFQYNWLENLGKFSAALAIVGTLIYILGLVALGAPIYRLYTHDVSITWQAMSLAPRTMVAGLGVQRLFAVPAWVFSYVAASFILAHFVIGLLSVKGEKAATWLGEILTIVFAVSFNFLFLHGLWVSREVSVSDVVGVYRFADWTISVISWGAIVVYLMGCKVGFDLITQVRWRPERFLPGLDDPKRVSQALVAWLGILFLAGLMQAIVAQPPLPAVEVYANDSATPTEGTLLVHADGYWYIFVTETHALKAIADSKALNVKVPAAEE